MQCRNPCAASYNIRSMFGAGRQPNSGFCSVWLNVYADYASDHDWSGTAPLLKRWLVSSLCIRGIEPASLVEQDRRAAFQSELRPTHLQEWTTSVSVLNAASTAALARNALREAGAPVFLALRYRAAYTPTCHEDRVLCPEGGRNAPATLDILAPAEERGQLRVSQGLGFECRAALAVPARGLAEKMRR